MGCLQLENSWDCWMAQFYEDAWVMLQNGGIKPNRREKPYTNNVKTKFSRQGDSMGGKFPGWNGAKPQKKHWENVKRNRLMGEDEEEEYLEKLKNEVRKKKEDTVTIPMLKSVDDDEPLYVLDGNVRDEMEKKECGTTVEMPPLEKAKPVEFEGNVDCSL